jgi:SAM-dependent methyltransferase
MGTAAVQGELWGAKAEDWALLQEPTWRPVYDAVLTRANVGNGTMLLDVGCGAGGALALARERGALTNGLDAAPNLVAVARRRLPDARIEVGEMEDLPFANDAFDVVTSFNAFQFAGDVVQALREAGRVCRPGGTVAMLVWGPREHCDLIAATMPAVFALLPPAPNQAAAPIAFAEPGVIEELMRKAKLMPAVDGEIGCAFSYPDAATAWRAIASAAPLVRAVRHAGEDAVKQAVLGTLTPFVRGDGSVVHNNRFRFVIAKRA